MDLIRNQHSAYSVQILSTMRYQPKIKNAKIKSRKFSSFLYVIQGQYRYNFEDTEFFVNAGEAVYLPVFSQYEFSILSEETESIQVEFLLEDDERQSITFSKYPVLLDDYSNSMGALFFTLPSSYNNEIFSAISSVCQLCSIMEKRLSSANKSGLKLIEPATCYIEQHFCDKLYVAQLAELCNISESQLRRLFAKHLGLSPIRYKNSILMKNACNMLCNDDFSISEVAEKLNFADIYTFSQLFKREYGVSPKNFKNLQR